MKYSRLLSVVFGACLSLACLVVAGGCASPPGGSANPATLDPAHAIAAVNTTLDAAVVEVDQLQAAVTQLQVALAAEPNGTEQFKSIEHQLAERQAELGTARVYLRFAQIFARALTPPPPAAAPTKPPAPPAG